MKKPLGKHIRLNTKTEKEREVMIMTESGIRKKLARQSYKLRKGKDFYGCTGYSIANSNDFIVTNNVNLYDMSLEDVEKWLEE